METRGIDASDTFYAETSGVRSPDLHMVRLCSLDSPPPVSGVRGDNEGHERSEGRETKVSMDPRLCKAPPCDNEERCFNRGCCCYKSSKDIVWEQSVVTTPEDPDGRLTGNGLKLNSGSYEYAKQIESFSKTILGEAYKITGDGGERNDSYDHPGPNFNKIAKVWSVLLGVDVSPEQTALCMIAVKLVRGSHKYKRDHIVDIAGYARCIERLRDEEWEGKYDDHD